MIAFTCVLSGLFLQSYDTTNNAQPMPMNIITSIRLRYIEGKKTLFKSSNDERKTINSTLLRQTDTEWSITKRIVSSQHSFFANLMIAQLNHCDDGDVLFHCYTMPPWQQQQQWQYVDQLEWKKKRKAKKRQNERTNEANEKLLLLDEVLSLQQNDECDLVHIFANAVIPLMADAIWVRGTHVCVCAPQSMRVNRFPHSFGGYAGQVRTGKGELVESNGTTAKKADSKVHIVVILLPVRVRGCECTIAHTHTFTAQHLITAIVLFIDFVSAMSKAPCKYIIHSTIQSYSMHSSMNWTFSIHFHTEAYMRFVQYFLEDWQFIFIGFSEPVCLSVSLSITHHTTNNDSLNGVERCWCVRCAKSCGVAASFAFRMDALQFSMNNKPFLRLLQPHCCLLCEYVGFFRQ